MAEARFIHRPYDVVPLAVTADGWRVIHNGLLEAAAAVAAQRNTQQNETIRRVLDWQLEAYSGLAAEIARAIDVTPTDTREYDGDKVGDCLRKGRLVAHTEDVAELARRLRLP